MPCAHIRFTAPEKQIPQRKNKDADDGFQSRSQFYPVPQPFSAYESSASRFAPLPGLPGPIPSSGSHNLNPTANTFNPNAGPFVPSRQPGPTHPGIPPQYPVAFPPMGGYPMHPSAQPQNNPCIPQLNYNRPMMPSGLQPVNAPPMMRLPSAPQLGHGGSVPMNSRFPSINHGFPPPNNPINNLNRVYQYNQLPNQHFTNGISYQNQQPFFGLPSANMNNTMNGSIPLPGTMSGGWSGHNANGLQQGRLQQGEGPLANGHPGSFGAYGLGRG